MYNSYKNIPDCPTFFLPFLPVISNVEQSGRHRVSIMFALDVVAPWIWLFWLPLGIDWFMITLLIKKSNSIMNFQKINFRYLKINLLVLCQLYFLQFEFYCNSVLVLWEYMLLSRHFPLTISYFLRIVKKHSQPKQRNKNTLQNTREPK